MLDIRLVREDPDRIRRDLAKRRAPDKAKTLDAVIEADKAWRKALADADALKRRRNEITKDIAAAKKAGKASDKLQEEAAGLPKKIAALDQEVDRLAAQVRDGLLRLPNLLDETVPVGKDLYLIATSEHPIGAMFMDEVIDESRLPLTLTGLATQFRREIGAHGVDTKGLFRMHQFNKVEQFVFCRPEDSRAWHEKLRANGEAIYRALEIPYRVVDVCTGDIGTVAAKKYDIEAWFPRPKAYREVISCSNCTDYQARRLNVRAGKVGGDKFVPHTLNATAMATSRGLVAVLENYQNPDGSVTIPKVLRPYLHGQETIRGPGPA
jgi:seryl-tRNA synthetase